MKEFIVTIAFIVSLSVLSYSQDKIYRGSISYAYKDEGVKSLRFRKELLTINNEYVSKYYLFNTEGDCYSIISVIHNRKEKTIIVSAEPPHINIFKDGVYKYEYTYTDDTGLSLVVEDGLIKTLGDGIKNKLSVKFYSSKREHLKLIEIITGGSDVDNRYHYYLDK